MVKLERGVLNYRLIIDARVGGENVASVCSARAQGITWRDHRDNMKCERLGDLARRAELIRSASECGSNYRMTVGENVV